MNINLSLSVAIAYALSARLLAELDFSKDDIEEGFFASPLVPVGDMKIAIAFSTIGKNVLFKTYAFDKDEEAIVSHNTSISRNQVANEIFAYNERIYLDTLNEMFPCQEFPMEDDNSKAEPILGQMAKDLLSIQNRILDII